MNFRSLMYRFLAVLAVVLISFSAVTSSAQKKKRTSKAKPGIEAVSAEKNKNEKAIRSTSAKIEAKRAEIKRQLSNLSSINADIEENRQAIIDLTHAGDSIALLLASTEDSVMILNDRIEDLRRAYVRAMRRIQPYANSTSALSFIFSARDFKTGMQRIRYLREFSDWRRKRTERIETETRRLIETKSHLDRLKSESAGLLGQASRRQQDLDRNRRKADKVVASLRSDEAALRAVLEQQKKQAKALDARLDRLIAEEQARIAREEKARKEAEKADAAKSAKTKSGSSDKKSGGTADKKPESSAGTKAAAPTPEFADSRITDVGSLTGSFAENKGRLPFPVTGSYRIISRFGRQQHPSLPKVEIENSGIDIETVDGASARSVFAGKVSAIFREDGFNSIVMIRHGNYITIYAGLDRIAVKTGDQVKAGQTLGTVNRDKSRGTPILHFEIRNERTKLNPQSWLR